MRACMAVGTAERSAVHQILARQQCSRSSRTVDMRGESLRCWRCARWFGGSLAQHRFAERSSLARQTRHTGSELATTSPDKSPTDALCGDAAAPADGAPAAWIGMTTTRLTNGRLMRVGASPAAVWLGWDGRCPTCSRCRTS